MPSRRTAKSKSVAIQTAEMVMAVPSVVAHRVTRMALSGPMPSERDRKEFHRMGAEKVAAFHESWNAMSVEAAVAQQRLALSMVQSLLFPWSLASHVSHATPQQLQRSALGVLEKGLAPVHRRAVANAKRLRHTKLK